MGQDKVARVDLAKQKQTVSFLMRETPAVSESRPAAMKKKNLGGPSDQALLHSALEGIQLVEEALRLLLVRHGAGQLEYLVGGRLPKVAKGAKARKARKLAPALP
jgi:hypothetical protein